MLGGKRESRWESLPRALGLSWCCSLAQLWVWVLSLGLEQAPTCLGTGIGSFTGSCPKVHPLRLGSAVYKQLNKLEVFKWRFWCPKLIPVLKIYQESQARETIYFNSCKFLFCWLTPWGILTGCTVLLWLLAREKLWEELPGWSPEGSLLLPCCFPP